MPRTRIRWMSSVGIALAVSVMETPGSEAAPIFDTTVGVGCDAPTGFSQSASASDAAACDSGSAQAFAEVDSSIGSLRLSSGASVQHTGGPTNSAMARANVVFTDAFTVSAVDGSGQAVTGGTLTARVHAEGSLFASETDGADNGLGLVFYNITLGSFATGTIRVLANPSGGTAQVDIDREFLIEIPWTAGEAITYRAQVNADSSASSIAGTSPTGSVDFSNSLDWRGIVEVLDQSGAPVASFQALNDEGFDYVADLPEPAFSLFLLTAAVVLGRSRPGRG